MGKRWRIFPHDAGRISQLARSANLPLVVAQLLVARGVTESAAAREFLDPKLMGLRDPERLPGVTDVADRLHVAVKDRRRVVVYGDYDCDGMTAAAILFRCLKLIGGDVSFYVPNRLDEGYGLNDEALRTLAARGAQTVVTVDCGVCSVAESEVARELGLELLITDHHEFGEALPAAAAIAHPRLPGGDYPFGMLCGAGVALKVAWALCQRHCQAKLVTPALREFLVTAVGLAAIGTVADVVPLVDENRILVRHGLKSVKDSELPGLRALLEVASLDKKKTLGSDDFGFAIGPRLNAAGRLGQAQLGIELLVTDSSERATQLAQYLNELNESRDSLEKSIYLAALKQAQEQFDPENDPALVLAERGWHPGVIGIVAGRLVEKFNRPVILVSLDSTGVRPGSGSARTACGLPLHEALRACSSQLISHGGHAAAAGLKIEEDRIDAFRAEFCEFAAQSLVPERRVAELSIDAETPFMQLTYETVRHIEQLAPFGNGNPRPLLCTTGVELAAPPRRIGKGERHFSAKLVQNGKKLRAIAWGQGDWVEELMQAGAPLDIAYQPVINEFDGRTSVEIQLVDWRLSATPAPVLVS
jgi:single-stranded-DNA-specific exonuclease